MRLICASLGPSAHTPPSTPGGGDVAPSDVARAIFLPRPRHQTLDAQVLAFTMKLEVAEAAAAMAINVHGIPLFTVSFPPMQRESEWVVGRRRMPAAPAPTDRGLVGTG